MSLIRLQLAVVSRRLRNTRHMLRRLEAADVLSCVPFGAWVKSDSPKGGFSLGFLHQPHKALIKKGETPFEASGLEQEWP